MMNDDWTAVETFERCRYVMKQLFKSWFIGLAVLAVLVLLYAHLSAQNYNLHWVEVAIKVVGLPFLALLCTWFLFFSVLVFGTWRLDYWRTRELRKALIPPLPGNSPDDRGAQMLARFKRVKKWAKSAYVVKYRNNLEFVTSLFTSIRYIISSNLLSAFSPKRLEIRNRSLYSSCNLYKSEMPSILRMSSNRIL